MVLTAAKVAESLSRRLVEANAVQVQGIVNDLNDYRPMHHVNRRDAAIDVLADIAQCWGMPDAAKLLRDRVLDDLDEDALQRLLTFKHR